MRNAGIIAKLEMLLTSTCIRGTKIITLVKIFYARAYNNNWIKRSINWKLRKTIYCGTLGLAAQ